ncbi:MAG: TolC family protein [Proteobacteria bacterium]|nr:TolC family protein [Burkholderiales bacterium]
MNRSISRGSRPSAAAMVAVCAALLGGCASFSNDGGFDAVRQVARERLNQDLEWRRSAEPGGGVSVRVDELLAKPLSVDDAVQIALLNNRGLQANFFDLGISEAELVQAGRLPNPHFSMFRASRVENGVREFKIEQALTFNIFSLLILPQAVEVEKRRFEQTKHVVSEAVLRLAADTRKAFYAAVAAEESVRYMAQVMEAAEASAELARRMAQVGNFSRLQRAREQNFYADAALNFARSEQASFAARERLIRLMGLWGAQTTFTLPSRLPDLPKAAEDLPDVEAVAVSQRLDLLGIRVQTEALARNLGLTRTTRFINVFELGPARVLEGSRSEPYKNGYEVSFELPLFDWSGAKVARAEAIYMQALNVAADAAVQARSEVREAYVNYRSAFDIARHHREEIVPLRKRIADENLLRYNGMLIGVFELLADARAQIASINAAIEAQRDFWIAQSDLDMAMFGRSPASSPLPRSAMSSGDRAGGH